MSDIHLELLCAFANVIDINIKYERAIEATR
jgi:hypothetical protein